ncbi:MAG: glycosyltransferase family 2 protein [Planctomycetia bacterium]|nr:glycosyltransferase family 2 protein [Planctomycetia bacterium]
MPDRQSLATRQPISASMICQNEEANIARSLAALAWCDEIVVVDGGSTDRTCEIAGNWPGVRLLSRPFDTFINQKNFALDACRNEWNLSVDADEVFTPELCQEIAALPLTAAGYAIGRRTFLGDQEIRFGTWSPDYNLRLFSRSAGRWGGSNPHERVILNGRVERLRHRMLHYSYRTRQEFLARNEKYTRMSVEHIAGRRQRVLPGEAAVHAVGNFCKAYVLKQGFRDGAAGWFIAWHTARLSHLKYVLLAQRLRQAGGAAADAPHVAREQPSRTAA